MSTPADEITVDLDAAATEAAKNADKKSKNGAATASDEARVVVDKEVAAATASKDAVTTDEAVKNLKKQLDDEKAARVAAEDRARQAAEGEAKARGEVQISQLEQIKSGIDRVKQLRVSAKEKLKAAHAAQDFDAVATVQEEMSDLAAQLAQLEAGKTHLENAPKPTPRPPPDQVEAWVARIGEEFPRSRAWVRSHPEFVLDKRKNAEMIAAHELAMARGLKPESDEYFRSIEKTLDVGVTSTILPPHADDPGASSEVATTAAADATGGRQAMETAKPPASAPVSRGSGTRSNKVTLTKEQVEAAAASGLTPEEYAKQVLALKQEGRIS